VIELHPIKALVWAIGLLVVGAVVERMLSRHLRARANRMCEEAWDDAFRRDAKKRDEK
jgi:hypothetical protein